MFDELFENLVLYLVRIDTRFAKLIKNPSERFQRHVISDSLVDAIYLNKVSENIQLDIVNRAPDYIGGFTNPSEQVQLAAVRIWPWVIEKIKSPTIAVQLEYLKILKKNSGNKSSLYDYLKVINNPCDEIRREMFTDKLTYSNNDPVKQLL